MCNTCKLASELAWLDLTSKGTLHTSNLRLIHNAIE